MKNKTTLLLIELAALLLVFSLAAAVCLRLFVWADGVSKLDNLRDHALFRAQNAAEEIKASAGDLDMAAKNAGGSVKEGIWEASLPEGCLLRVTPQSADSPYLGRAQITVLDKKGNVLAQLVVHWQEEYP